MSLVVVLVIGLQASPLSAASPTGLLGLSPQQVQARLGPPSFIYHATDDTSPIYAYCIGGRYKPYYYDHMGHWVEETQSRPFPGDTIGPCAKSQPKRPETFFARYAGNRVAMIGYVTAHGNTYDRGWTDALDRIVAGVDSSVKAKELPVSNEKVQNINALDAILRYPNGVTGVFLEPQIGIVGSIFYSPGKRVELSQEPLIELWLTNILVR